MEQLAQLHEGLLRLAPERILPDVGHGFPQVVAEEIGGGAEPETGVETCPGGVQAYWGVDDVDAAYARLLSLGATQHEAPKEVGGSIKVATVLDPFGNILGLIFNPHFDPKVVR